jgi:hypothetical protein
MGKRGKQCVIKNRNLFFFFWIVLGTELSQGFVLAGQVLYYSASPSPPFFTLFIFEIGSSLMLVPAWNAIFLFVLPI